MKTLTIVSYQSPNNTYIKELIYNLGKYFKVFWGNDFFWDEEFFSDFYIIHWPENIKVADNRHSFSIDNLNDRIIILKKKGAIISAFFHDANPHFCKNEWFNQLFRTVFTNMNIVFHLGNYSVKLLNQMYPEAQTIKNVVIKHALFESIPNYISKRQARQRFGLNQNDFVIAFLGSFRTQAEIMLMYKIFKRLQIKNKKLLIGGGEIYNYKSLITKWFSRLRKYYYTGRKVITSFGKYVKDEDVQYYYNAADIVLIPRLENLNSGVAIMALTFNIPFISPAIGNITELAEETGNMTFPLADIQTAVNKIEHFSTNKNLHLNISSEYKGCAVAKAIAQQLNSYHAHL